MNKVVRAGLRAGAILAILSQAAALRAEAFTPEQRDEIIQIVRSALKRDPTILEEAIETVRGSQSERQKIATRQIIADNHDLLYRSGDPAAGKADADVTIVEFFDPRCPFCRQAEPMLQEMLARDRGLRVIYKDLPILGPASVLGSRALLAAFRQRGYNQLLGALMRAPPDITPPLIRAQAEALGLNWAQLDTDMQDPAIQQRLDGNVQLARALGIEGTPAFVVGDRLIVGSEMAEVLGAIASVRAAKLARAP